MWMGIVQVEMRRCAPTSSTGTVLVGLARRSRVNKHKHELQYNHSVLKTRSHRRVQTMFTTKPQLNALAKTSNLISRNID